MLCEAGKKKKYITGTVCVKGAVPMDMIQVNYILSPNSDVYALQCEQSHHSWKEILNNFIFNISTYVLWHCLFKKTYNNIHYIKEKYQINHWYTQPLVGNSWNWIHFPLHVNTIFSVLHCSGSPNSSQYSD